MRLARPVHPLAAATAAAVFLLAGCGGGGGGSKDDKIDGAGGSADKSASPSKSDAPAEGDAADFRTSDIELPDDVKLVFDWKQPSDEEKAAALDGAADYLRVVRRGMVKDDPDDPVLAEHTVPLQTAAEYATHMRKQHAEKNYTVTGSERLYKEQVGEPVDGKLVEVAFCSDQSEIFSKEIKTGKVIRNSATDDKNFVRFSVVMQKSSSGGESWKARSVEVTEKAVKQCGK
ncbi:hypothetical protein MMF93_12705 [Streptomyces tubbatahanensis]|uniref:Lipoprotein n=1 Tax=Streptomyces tubbatahanensis TaxID=2923272 RepID=A0ABY3XSR5_9ACTN|nr:hypothetical protein [Streptomyces tubbatahanensis]UNS97268.1 hypothetical protein MMF93_12705 [Streptomyces tubbatahanensis]